MLLRERLRADVPSERVAAMAELASAEGRPSREELAALLECLADERKVVQRRAAETWAVLVRRHPDQADSLRKGLGAEPWRLRWGKVFALSLADEMPAEALNTLLEGLASNDGDLRWAAAAMVLRSATHEASMVIPRLLDLARSGRSTERKMALYCLRDLKVTSRECLDAVRDALSAEEIDVRLAALSAYAGLAPQEAARSIARLMDDGDLRMRRAAVGTLGKLGDRSAGVIEKLRGARSSTDPSLRRAAERALKMLGEEQ